MSSLPVCSDSSYFFGFMGAASALVLACLGSAYGTAKSVSCKRKKEKFFLQIGFFFFFFFFFYIISMPQGERERIDNPKKKQKRDREEDGQIYNTIILRHFIFFI